MNPEQIRRMIKHILWDWNGTLLDDVEACVVAINRMLLRRRLPGIDVPAYRCIFDFPVRACYERLGFDLAAEDWNAVASEFHTHYAELAHAAPLRAGIADVLVAVAGAGIGMSVLSACETGILHRMLEQRGIHSRFTHISGLDNIDAVSKLDNGRRLLHALGLPPDAVLLVGDTNHDYHVAEALGIDCIMLAGGHQDESRLEAETILTSAGGLLPRIHAAMPDAGPAPTLPGAPCPPHARQSS